MLNLHIGTENRGGTFVGNSDREEVSLSAGVGICSSLTISGVFVG